MRAEKASIVQDIQEWIRKSPYLIVVDYAGMTVEQFSELRRRLREVRAELHVVKNTLLKKALANENVPGLDESLNGQSAVAYGPEEISAAAKVLKNFRAEFERPVVKAGILDRAALAAESIAALADLPSREVLLAQLLGLLNTPARRLVTVIHAPASQLARVLQAKSEKGD